MADDATPDDSGADDGFNPFSAFPMFGDIAKALQGQGPLNWDAARQFAMLGATQGEPEHNVDPADRIAFTELARIAAMHVNDVTGVDAEFPDSESARGSVTLGSEVAIDLSVRYRDEAAATKAVALVSKEIEDFPQGMLGTLEVSRDGTRLVLSTRINALITEMIAHMATEALTAPSPP